MPTKQQIQKLVAGLKYDVGFEDVSNEPSYVVDEIIKIFNEFIDGVDTIIIKNTQWERDDTYPVEVVALKPLKEYLNLWREAINQ
jgi:hypothetical protein